MMKKVVLSWAVAAAWMAVIFMFSAQPAGASNGLSNGVAEVLMSIVNLAYPLDMESSGAQSFIEQLNGSIRVLAHGAVYLVLALLVSNALSRSGSRGLKLILYTMGICAFYAFTDEIHQLFVPGRACELSDFLADCFGAFTGSLLFLLRHRGTMR